MARQNRQQEPAGMPAGPLPSTRWTVLGPVQWPGHPGDRIDEVVVGPSGVFVITHRRGQSGTAADLEPARTTPPRYDDAIVGRARRATAAVAGMLPDRYRHAARAVVCLCDTEDLGWVVDGVRVASPGPLRFAVRHELRVLSTSEVAGVSRRLQLALDRCPPEPGDNARSRRSVWARLTAAGLAAATASALLLAIHEGRLW